jgi:homogentisate 1,2-dioxygenase
MPYYISRGEIPAKRHTVYRQPDGSLYHEELVSTEGFSDVYSLVYHIFPPTRILRVKPSFSVAPTIALEKSLQPRSFQGFRATPTPDYLAGRQVVMTNADVQLIVAAPTKGTEDYFFKNADADELIFVHQGSGVVETIFGSLPFRYGDYIHIPRGIIYRITFDTTENRLMITESFSPIRFPKKYLNQFGQLLEHSPFTDRDLRLPQNLQTYNETGEFEIRIKKQDIIYPFIYANHPFDAIGWDGCFYPYILSIHDFEPITGRVHLPPPIHQTFEAHNFVVCSFCPRLYDYHPLSIPAPYHHSNIDSDEVLYYVEGEFMSRKHVEKGQFTLHPGGIPHGPHPGTIEKSIGAKETLELAVMVDTFKPLKITTFGFEISQNDYMTSWI